AMGQVHGPHAATSDESVNLVWPDPLSIKRAASSVLRIYPARGRRRFFSFARVKKRMHLGCKRRVPPASDVNECRTLFVGSPKRLVKDGLDAQQGFRRVIHSGHDPHEGVLLKKTARTVITMNQWL